MRVYPVYVLVKMIQGLLLVPVRSNYGNYGITTGNVESSG